MSLFCLLLQVTFFPSMWEIPDFATKFNGDNVRVASKHRLAFSRSKKKKKKRVKSL